MSTDDDEEEENAVATLTTRSSAGRRRRRPFSEPAVVLLEYYRDAMRRDVECERRGGQSRGFQSEGPVKHNL